MGEAGVKRTALAMAFMALAMAGCTTKDYLPVNGGGGRTAVAASSEAPPPTRVSGAGDQCGAGPLQYLVGKSKDEIPVALEPSRRRVICTTCPATMDMRPDRQTIRYDEATKKVVSITCG